MAHKLGKEKGADGKGKAEELPEPSRGADLGLEAHPVLSYALSGYAEWRNTGLIVASVREDGPAARAGIQVGDVLFQIEESLLLSLDDLKDLLAVSLPESQVRVHYLRSGMEEKATVKLGRAEDSSDEGALSWHYAGLAQLTRALEYAETAGRTVLVGLSGSDT